MFDKLCLLYTYYLRLAVKAPMYVESYYIKNAKTILSWAGLTAHTELATIVSTQWEPLTQHLTSIRDCIGHHLAIIYYKYPALYQEHKKWYSIRYEYFGLTHLTTIGSFTSTVAPADAIGALGTGPNQSNLIKILGAYAIYGNYKVEYGSVLANMGFQVPVFTELDAQLGKFARCLSPKYLNWLTFNHNLKISALLLGFAASCNPQISRPESILKEDMYEIGYEVAEQLMLVNIETDDVASDIMKKAYCKIKTKKTDTSAISVVKPTVSDINASQSMQVTDLNKDNKHNPFNLLSQI